MPKKDRSLDKSSAISLAQKLLAALEELKRLHFPPPRDFAVYEHGNITYKITVRSGELDMLERSVEWTEPKQELPSGYQELHRELKVLAGSYVSHDKDDS